MIRFTILGEPASKANSRQLVRFGNRPAIIKSQKSLNYESTAMIQIPAEARQMLQGRLRITLRIFYASERPDLDESVILDVLQAKFKGTGTARQLVRRGVYLNDRQIREKHVFHAVDRQNPRAEIEIEALDQQEMAA
jgi:hypothetical protein